MSRKQSKNTIALTFDCPPAWLVMAVLEHGNLLTHCSYIHEWDAYVFHVNCADGSCAVQVGQKRGDQRPGYLDPRNDPALQRFLTAYSEFVHQAGQGNNR